LAFITGIYYDALSSECQKYITLFLGLETQLH